MVTNDDRWSNPPLNAVCVSTCNELDFSSSIVSDKVYDLDL